MSRFEEIAKKLNSVGLDDNDAFRDVLTDYFGENGESDSESDNDSPIFTQHSDETPRKISPQSCEEANNAVPNHPMFHMSCADDGASLQVPDAVEQQLINEFMQKSCCHLKCTDKFNKELVVRNRQNAKKLNLSKNKNMPRTKDRVTSIFKERLSASNFFFSYIQ